MSKKSDRENQLAEVLDDAGVLAPLMNVAMEQIEQESEPEKNQRPKESAARAVLRSHFPDYSDEMLDAMENEF